MIPYFLTIIISLISHLLRDLRNSRTWYIIYISILCIFLCFGYMCGSDWRQYETMYYDNDFSYRHYEPGFLIYMTICRELHFDFWTFSILTKIVQFIIVSYSIKTYAPAYRYLVWMFLLPKSGFYMFIDYPMRNMIATAIFLFSVKYILRKDSIRYMLCALLATSFHASAIITIPLYYIINRNISVRTYIICFIIVFSIFASRDIFDTILFKVTGLSPYVLKQVEFYVEGDSIDGKGSFISVGMFLQIFFYMILLKFKNSIVCYNRYGLIVLNGALLYILLYRLGLTIGIFSRFQLYLVVLYAVGIVLLINNLAPTIRNIAIYSLFLLCCITGYQDIRKDGWKYVPYSNYLPYILSGEFPSFYYRESYNARFTPYKDSIE